ncbi:DUF4174 domain-containing protein [Pontibaca salina]|uniref:DUF4174 domain-containing protein n=1 Tax=Pontibaca salina TaxID=2795731 RepID=A0A934HK72_9RHOB|nr:DUF4174 domain-containing protein [Pontibaca salina]MBI6629628.1 DUF4174 domain-containing protein [Pontibaca salina]
MKKTLAFVLSILIAVPAFALESADAQVSAIIQPADDADLSEFLWTNRPLIVFADSPADPRFTQQIANIKADPNALRVRDVIVLTDTDPAARSPLRQKLRPRGFMLVLIAKDGSVTQRKPLPWTVREISRAIDKTPERKREIEDRRGDG